MDVLAPVSPWTRPAWMWGWTSPVETPSIPGLRVLREKMRRCGFALKGNRSCRLAACPQSFAAGLERPPGEGEGQTGHRAGLGPEMPTSGSSPALPGKL